MALTELKLVLEGSRASNLTTGWSHTGVVGSGELEIMMEPENLEGKTAIKVITPVKGFDEVWKMVLERFVLEEAAGNLSIEINDNNATPFVVAMRLKQAVLEAEGGAYA